MIAGVICLAGPLFDHDPLPVARPATQFRIHIILTVSTIRETSFMVVKRTPADIAGKWCA